MDDLVSRVRQIRDEATQRVKDDSLELVADIFGAIEGQFAITEHRKARMAAAAGADHGRDREA